MTELTVNETRDKVRDTLVQASVRFRPDQRRAYERAVARETVDRAKWALQAMLDNALVAETNISPMCDDTGIPHLVLEVGEGKSITSSMIDTIQQGVAAGLRALPGRPMAIKGDLVQRLEQSAGLEEDPAALLSAPMLIWPSEENILRLHILMQGGGPEIRGRTYRVFHQHKLSVIIDEVVNWAVEGASKLGCTPCVPAIGIGRTHYEATALMLEAMIKGSFDNQSEIEQEITDRVNQSGIGPMGLGGRTTALASFVRVGPQRASGVRIVCLRLGCCVEPRVASVCF